MAAPEESGFRMMLRLRGRSLKILSGPSAGQTFRATINRIGAFAFAGELGDDPRGKRVMEAASDCPPLVSQNQIRDMQNNERYAVVAIGLDSPDYSKKFELRQLIAGDK